MNEEAQMCLDEAKEGMEDALGHLDREFQKLRAGKASPQMLEGIIVDYYGAMTPIEQTANINTPDPRQIIVQPWDKSILGELEKAILNANLGFTPKNEGEVLRISVPPLTEERRLELVKKAKGQAETTRISIRNTRRTANDLAKSLEKDGLPEDESKRVQDMIQELTDDYIKKVDEMLDAKEKDVMTV
ncbi:MAG: ribosome recycling factor [Bacteroidetes bacterium]|nr:MAG: ribosome recycling factor [Bacteroidota bacterium]